MAYLLLSDGTPLYYEDTGPRDAPAILLVPGWTFRTDVWRRQSVALSSDFRVISCDLRGAGRSGKSLDRHSLAEYADDLAQLIESLSLDRCAVVGWALGASVAAHLAFGPRATLVSHLVWVDHSPCFFAVPNWDYALYETLTPEAMSATVSRLFTDRRAVVSSLLDDIFSKGLSDEDRADFYAASFQTPVETAARMLMLVSQADLRPMLSRIACPVLVVNGADSVVPWRVGQWLSRALPRGESLLLPDAGHAPFWDKPEAFNEGIRAFLLKR